jgi:hypothetical protein
MPELVKHEGTWNDVRGGDLVNGKRVETIDKKQKFAFITFTFDGDDQIRPWRKALADPITFERSQATEAEKAELRKMFIFDTMRDWLIDTLKNSPTHMLEELLEKNRHSGGDGNLAYEVLTWSTLPGILQAQALYKVARRIRGHLEKEPDVATYDDLLTAYAKWWLVERDNALSVHRDPLSRSTSTVSNLLEDLDEWAVHRLTDKFGWTDVRRAIERRAAELVAQHSR